MRYDKLVRDQIPTIIEQEGKIARCHVASDDEYWQALKAKLQEEVGEFCRSEAVEELADLLEIIDAICTYRQIDTQALHSLQQAKAGERGGFNRRLILEEVVEPNEALHD